MSTLDDDIIVEVDTGRDLNPRYMHCIIYKQIKPTNEFVS